MKKVIFILIATLFLASCTKPVSVIKQAQKDYSEALTEAPDSLVAFYEIEMVLDKPVSESNAKLLYSKTVIQEDTLVKMINRFYEKDKISEQDVEFVGGNWFGDAKMYLDSITVDLYDAIEILYKTNTILPEADKVTLRRPLSPPFKHYYIFGTYGTFFVAVDAITGEVSEFTK